MQEEMRKNTLGSLVENEKKGTIYAKITKSHPYNTIHGGYFDYSLWIGKILDCKATKEFGDSDTTIETLETAIQYFHYGDQITIVSFEKLVDKVQDFRVFPGKGEWCFPDPATPSLPQRWHQSRHRPESASWFQL